MAHAHHIYLLVYDLFSSHQQLTSQTSQGMPGRQPPLPQQLPPRQQPQPSLAGPQLPWQGRPPVQPKPQEPQEQAARPASYPHHRRITRTHTQTHPLQHRR